MSIRRRTSTQKSERGLLCQSYPASIGFSLEERWGVIIDALMGACRYLHSLRASRAASGVAAPMVSTVWTEASVSPFAGSCRTPLLIATHLCCQRYQCDTAKTIILITCSPLVPQMLSSRLTVPLSSRNSPPTYGGLIRRWTVGRPWCQENPIITFSWMRRWRLWSVRAADGYCARYEIALDYIHDFQEQLQVTESSTSSSRSHCLTVGI